jgi:hypothetical protein
MLKARASRAGVSSHADCSAHTRRAYERVGSRFIEALHAAGSDLRRATVEDNWNAGVWKLVTDN